MTYKQKKNSGSFRTFQFQNTLKSKQIYGHPSKKYLCLYKIVSADIEFTFVTFSQLVIAQMLVKGFCCIKHIAFASPMIIKRKYTKVNRILIDC